MKKQKIKTNFNFALAFFSLFLLKCSNNDTIYQETFSNESDRIQTLSYEEIANFSSSYFNNSDKSNLYSKSSKHPFIIPILDSITQEKITNSNDYITIIPTKKTKKNVDSRVLLLKINDSIQSIVFSMVSDKTKFNDPFSGRIYISNLSGEFIDGYVVNNGYLTAKLVQKTREEKSNLTARTTLSSNVEECPYDDKRLCELDTVTITASSGDSDSIAITYIYSGYTYTQNNQNTSDNSTTFSWYYSGISSGNFNIVSIDIEEDTPPSCESFNFQKTTSNWQEASVLNIRFNIVVIEIVAGIRVKKIIPIIFPQPVRFGVPQTFSNNSVISPGLAAELSAKAIEDSIDDVIARYNNLVVNSTDEIRNQFMERLKHNLRERTNGGRVNFNDMALGLTPTQYKTSAFFTDGCQ